ncbi:hypothetical protein HAP41_0000006475 [Bradyrhizobium barranii subsp. apii]|uniref:Uncharacterized protein n=1 Tax=Bradyrhizobium barranii subsp. apii TaxID=2819348 RepID=A0A8T5VUX1_9BRAD|nr:hypothetical protein [Bradyrhizobium barranii]UPT88719.1 hypothetical protein HAP41_0000006475 [Bradyrhizobium barranii subsp. apii]
MTKAENRAAAKAYHQERMRQRAEEARAEAVKADLAELDRLRKYLISGKNAGEPADELVSAIDDYVEKLTGNRTTLHTHNHRGG